jgi:hypothetical protein
MHSLLSKDTAQKSGRSASIKNKKNYPPIRNQLQRRFDPKPNMGYNPNQNNFGYNNPLYFHNYYIQHNNYPNVYDGPQNPFEEGNVVRNQPNGKRNYAGNIHHQEIYGHTDYRQGNIMKNINKRSFE